MKTTHKIILIPVLMIISGCSYQGSLAPDDSDPYEQSNRGFFEFNEELDEAILEPVADTYDVVVPEIAQSGFINFMKNAESPINIMNLFLQGRPIESLESLLNFSINSTIGILGIFDPASKMGLKSYDEDFGTRYYRAPEVILMGEISEKVDIVDVFRRSEHVVPIVKEAIKINAKAIWLQDGVINEEAAQVATSKNLLFVMNDCMLRRHHQL